MALALRASKLSLVSPSLARTASRATLFSQGTNAGGRWSLKCFAVGAGALTVGGGGALIYALENSVVNATEFIAHPHAMPWGHAGNFSSFDIRSVRRGWEVYKQVCKACHSLKFIYFRYFVNSFMTEEETKAEAAEFTIKDTNDDGQVIERACVINDRIPNPYPNGKAAKAANNGAAPPDLTLMTGARHGGENYMFALLTGYFDPPAGIAVEDGKAYNPYFPGGIIAMPQQLYDEGVEFSDGTPATQSQQAKDVTTFLSWCAEPYHDTRKRWALKILFFTPLLTIALVYLKRSAWTFMKSRKTAFKTVKGREPPVPPKQ